MNLIDTHSHIYMSEFKEDISDVVLNAKNRGVEKILMPNVDASSIEPMMHLANNFPGYCIPMMGIHPTSVKDDYQEELSCIGGWFKKERFVAIGEIGIDLYWDKKHLKEQIVVFETQVKWAVEYDLPIVIHARDSFDELFHSLDRIWDPRIRGVFHSFTGDECDARKIIEYGSFYLGINGIATFKNSHLPNVLKDIDLECILLETDAPYLAPVPKRGRRNEPAYVGFVADKIAEIKMVDVSEVCAVTTSNAKRLFSI